MLLDGHSGGLARLGLISDMSLEAFSGNYGQEGRQTDLEETDGQKHRACREVACP